MFIKPLISEKIDFLLHFCKSVLTIENVTFIMINVIED